MVIAGLATLFGIVFVAVVAAQASSARRRRAVLQDEEAPVEVERSRVPTPAPASLAEPSTPAPNPTPQAPPTVPTEGGAPLLVARICTEQVDPEALEARALEHQELYRHEHPATVTVHLERRAAGQLDLVFPEGIPPYDFGSLALWVKATRARIELPNGEIALVAPDAEEPSLVGSTSAGFLVEMEVPEGVFTRLGRSGAVDTEVPGGERVRTFELIVDRSAFSAGQNWPGPDDAIAATPEVAAPQASSHAQVVQRMIEADALLDAGDPRGPLVREESALLEAILEASEAPEESAVSIALARAGVRGTYDSLAAVVEIVLERLHDDGCTASPEVIGRLVDNLEAQRALDEADWPEQTMNDRITAAFDALRARGILALENAGWSNSDGWSAIAEVRAQRPGWGHGAAFFHEQDVARGIDGQGLLVTFGPLQPDSADDDDLAVQIGRGVVEELEAHGVPTTWSGDTKMRIEILPFEWARRRRR